MYSRREHSQLTPYEISPAFFEKPFGWPCHNEKMSKNRFLWMAIFVVWGKRSWFFQRLFNILILVLLDQGFRMIFHGNILLLYSLEFNGHNWSFISTPNFEGHLLSQSVSSQWLEIFMASLWPEKPTENSNHREEIVCHRKKKFLQHVQFSCMVPDFSSRWTALPRLCVLASDHKNTRTLSELRFKNS